MNRLASFAVVTAVAVAIPSTLSAAPARIGTGPTTCTLGPKANRQGANLIGADFTYADLEQATTWGWITTGATWSQTTCPSGNPTNTGC